MDNFKQSKQDVFYRGYTDKADNINELIKKLNEVCYPKTQESFADLCITVYELSKLFNGYEIEYQVDYGKFKGFAKIMADFGFDKTQTSRILNCYEKYIENGNIKPIFFPFSKSKLFELLLVDTKQLEHDIEVNIISDKSTVTTLRKYVKNYQALQRIKETQELDSGIDVNRKPPVDETEIPMKYDPQHRYEYDYFKSKSKTQLLNIVWELQKFAHRNK